jgi:SNF2 family DNA or RNA helicase
MNEPEVVEGEIVEFNVAEKQAAYEAIADIDKVDEETLTKLIEEERAIMAALNECRKKQQDIKDKRFKRRVQLAQAERELNEAKLKEEEAQRYRRLEEQKAEAFRDMVRYCEESEFAWIKTAMPHQWEGAMTIAHYGSAILGDEPGLGKTITGIMSWDMKKSKKVLVVVPNEIVSVFSDTIQIWAPHRNLIPIAGATPQVRKMVKHIVETSSEFTLVINYESLWRDFSWLENVEWDDITVDEAHNMKNESGLTFNAVDTFKYKHFLAMTATSILNEPKDLYTSLHMVAPQQFWNSRSFLQNYCMQNADGKWIFRPGGEKALMRSMKGRFIKRSKEEAGIEWPTQHVNEVVIPADELTEKQSQMIEQIHNFGALALESGEVMEIPAMIAVITRERQACCYPAGIEVKVTKKMFDANPALPVGHVLFKVPDDTPAIKIDRGGEMVKTAVSKGHRTVVFSQFKTALTGMEKRLTELGLRVARFDGDTPRHQRVNIKRDFLRQASGEHTADYKYDVVLVNYKAGGVGLNFTDATYMLVLDEEWNPGKNTQAWGRIARIGQTEETYVDILRIQPSIDMWMKTLNEEKQAMINGFEQEIDMVASLKEYFAKPAVEPQESKAIEAPVYEEPDEDFLNLLNGL